MKTNAEDVETILDAVEIIRQMGWSQGAYIDEDDGTVCTVGAVCLASNGTANAMYEDDMRLLRLIIEHAGIPLPAYAESLTNAGESYDPDPVLTVWNDRDGRTVEDVIIALEQTAADLKRKE